MSIRGNPERLEHYTSITLPTLPPAHTEASSYGSIIRALMNAPSSISLWYRDFSAFVESELSIIESVDKRPAAFSFALRQLDHFVPDMPRDRTYLYTNDVEFFDALVNARLAHPNDTAANVYTDALDALTGSPGQLAAQITSVINDINGSMNKDDVDALKDELRMRWAQQSENNGLSSTPLTDAELVQRVWLIVSGNGDDGIVPAAMVQRLQTLTGLLARRRFDPAYSTAFYQALGPDLAAKLPDVISLAAWSDNQRTAGQPTFNVQSALAATDSSLALASPNLDTSWRDALFAHAESGKTLNDAFPLLFTYGQYAASFAQPAGQLGLDVLHGKVVVDRGVGSPGYPNFDNLATHWEDRGTILLAAAARTPDAANALLRNPDNVNWITDNKFGRRGHDGDHPPNWDVIAPSVRELIVSGTVYEASTDPSLARDAAANVINAAVNVKSGAASDALAPAYGQMVLQYLPDFARSPAFNLAAQNHDGIISVGTLQAAQFTSLAMHDDSSKQAIFTIRDMLDLQTVVVGLETNDPMYPPWAQRLANLDGIVLTADNGQVFVSARQQDAEAKQYNENLDLFQSIVMGVVGLAKFPGSGIVEKAIDNGVDKLKTDYLYEATNHASEAGYTTNVADFSAFDHERLVVAEGQLIAAVHAEQSGANLTTDQSEFIRHAQQMLGQPYVDSLRSAATGGVRNPVQLSPRQLQEWAGNTPLDQGFTDVSNYTDLILPNEGSSLWPH